MNASDIFADPGNRKRLGALAFVVLLTAALGVFWLLWMWLFASQREITENAYVGGHQVQISAQVAGQVRAIYADEMQSVQAGQVLIELDSSDAQVALDRARAELAHAAMQARELADKAAQDDELIVARKGELQAALADLQRREPLLKTQAIAPEQLAHARTQATLARTALAAARHQAAATRAMAGGTDIAAHPAVQIARAAFIDAWLRLQRGRIVAPVAGDIAQRTVQLGYSVAPGAALMRIVPRSGLWVDANFKEAELGNLRIGQPAQVRVDLYGSSVRYHGRVAGFSAGTGAAFALLPPQNAVGNWVRVVQRLPVRIALDPAELAAHPLRVGLSAKVRIDTHDRSGAALATAATPAVAELPAQTLAPAEAEADRVIAEHASPST